MFHMLEAGATPRAQLITWLCTTPITGPLDLPEASDVVQSLVHDGALREQGDMLLAA